jgi:hypothetical protein
LRSGPPHQPRDRQALILTQLESAQKFRGAFHRFCVRVADWQAYSVAGGPLDQETDMESEELAGLKFWLRFRDLCTQFSTNPASLPQLRGDMHLDSSVAGFQPGASSTWTPTQSPQQPASASRSARRSRVDLPEAWQAAGGSGYPYTSGSSEERFADSEFLQALYGSCMQQRQQQPNHMALPGTNEAALMELLAARQPTHSTSSRSRPQPPAHQVPFSQLEELGAPLRPSTGAAGAGMRSWLAPAEDADLHLENPEEHQVPLPGLTLRF